MAGSHSHKSRYVLCRYVPICGLSFFGFGLPVLYSSEQGPTTPPPSCSGSGLFLFSFSRPLESDTESTHTGTLCSTFRRAIRRLSFLMLPPHFIHNC